jgi:hypothetical protein
MPALSYTPENMLSVLLLLKGETRRLFKDGDGMDVNMETFPLATADIRDFACDHNPEALRLDLALGNVPIPVEAVRTAKGALKYAVGRTYAIVPGRGKPAVGRVKVTHLSVERLNQITQESVDRECFGATPAEYIAGLRAMYRKPAAWNPLLVAIRF